MGSLVVLGWAAVLIAFCYFPIIVRLVRQWSNDDDMGHGFFVPVIAGWIVWQKMTEGELPPPTPDWRGLIVLLGWGAFQMYICTLGTELFLSRTALVITIIGTVWLLVVESVAPGIFSCFRCFCSSSWCRFPLLFTPRSRCPCRQFASVVAEMSPGMSWGIPVSREGNVLELPNMRLNVVEACSGI